jgi:hypothetical protein
MAQIAKKTISPMSWYIPLTQEYTIAKSPAGGFIGKSSPKSTAKIIILVCSLRGQPQSNQRSARFRGEGQRYSGRDRKERHQDLNFCSATGRKVAKISNLFFREILLL